MTDWKELRRLSTMLSAFIGVHLWFHSLTGDALPESLRVLCASALINPMYLQDSVFTSADTDFG